MARTQPSDTPGRTEFTLGSFLFSLGIGILIASLCTGSLSFWEPTSPKLLGLPHCGAISMLLIASGILICRVTGERPRLLPEGFSFPLLLLIITDWFARSYSFIDASASRGVLLCTFVAAGTLVYCNASRVFRWFGLAACALCFMTFLGHLGGRLLFSDDHATFLYRLLLLRENFPSIPFYNPQWNAGIDQRDFFATGSLNVFFFSWPLIYFSDLTRTYSVFVALILFVLVPGATFLAARLAGFSKTAQAIAAMLVVTSGLPWYRWALLYGTMGFIISAALLPLNIILATRIIDRERPLTWSIVILSTFSFSLMLCWSLSGLVFIPLLALALWRAPFLLRKPLLPTLVALLLLVNVPWITLFWSVSNVGTFLHAEKSSPDATRAAFDDSEDPNNEQLLESDPEVASSISPPTTITQTVATTPSHVKSAAKPLSPKRSLRSFREFTVSMNPLLLLLCIPGILALPRRYRLPFAVTAGWLLGIGILAAPMKPQLELDRMLVVLGQLSALAVGPFLATTLGNLPARGTSLRIFSGGIFGGFLIFGAFATTSVLQNRTLVHYHAASSLLKNAALAAKEKGGSGRILFSGFLLHELNGGHGAPLPFLSGKTFLASSHVHNVWRYQDFIPPEVEAGGEKTLQPFLDTYAVSAIFAHEEKWKDYFTLHPEHYEKVWEQGRFTLFRRIGAAPSLFLKGDGTVLSENSNSVTVKLNSTDAIIKYRYFPFLTVNPRCSISEHVVDPALSYVEFTNCPTGEPLTLSAGSAWRRLISQ